MNNISSHISTQQKEMIIDVFKAFISVCEQHDLQYFCCGGTAIGTLRHKGMIPWDDDIDILMPRPDYNRFVNLFDELDISNSYELFTAKTNASYYLPFAKMCDKNSTILEYEDIPCVLGVFIDIFPLDGAADDKDQRDRQLLGFRRAANKLLVLPKSMSINLKSAIKRFISFQIRTAWNELYYTFSKKQNREKVLQEIDRYLLSNSYSISNFFGNYGGMWGIKEFGPKEWFSDYVTGEFEGLSVRLPIGVHKLLTQMYGDYMQLPPEEKRGSHHNVAYLNLDKRLDVSEVLKLIKK